MSGSERIKIGILALSERGGGNLTLNSLTHCSDAYDVKSSSTFRSKFRFPLKTINYLIKISRTLIIGIYWSIVEQRTLVYSETIIVALSFLFRKKHRCRYIQSDDRNLHIVDDGHHPLLIALYKIVAKLADKVPQNTYISNSEFVRNILLSNTGHVSEVIHPPVISTYHVYIPKMRRIRLNHPERMRVGAIYRKHKRKGFGAFREIAKNWKRLPNVEFVVLTDKQELDDFSGLTVETFKDRETLFSMYESLDVFISTSTFEGFGLTVFESMIVGTPVIALRNGGVLEIYRENSMILVDDMPELEGALYNLLIDNAKREELSKFGKARAKELSSDDLISKFLRKITAKE